MGRLILVNGPPGIGKSSVAERYVADHPLALLLDIDAVRMSMGRWQDHTESRALAREIALGLIGHHSVSRHISARLSTDHAEPSVPRCVPDRRRFALCACTPE